MKELLTISEIAKILKMNIKPTRKRPKGSDPKMDHEKYVLSRLNYDIMRGRLKAQKKTITKEIIVLDIEEVRKFYGLQPEE